MSYDESDKAYDDLCLLFTKYLILVDTHLGDSDIEVLAAYDEDSRYETIITTEEVAQIKEMQKHVSRVERVEVKQCEEKCEVGSFKGIKYPCVLVENHPGRHAFHYSLSSEIDYVDEDGSAWDGDDELVY